MQTGANATQLDTIPPRNATAGRDTPTLLDMSGDPSPSPELPNSEASPYQILNEIGRGGMSTVYLAKDLKLGRFVAIKRLSQAFLTDSPMRDRFLREAQLIASLNHIYIVKLYDFDVKRTEPQIVMEYVAGPGKAPAPNWPPLSLNLEQKLEQNEAPLSMRVSVVLVKKLCTAIEYAHRRGVIHRDLKPSNVLLDEHGEPRIVDFGIARQTTSDAAKLTMTGTRMLSLGYAAPEQETNPAIADERSDVYSLGGILYFCLTGENPRFFRDSRVPDCLRPIILKAMEQDPTQRWASAKDFADVLAQTAGDFLSPLTDPGMWRCKWCNALNAVDSRYCTHCNWDGMESCPECAGETRVGVRFCGQCSTDIKTFEDMRALLSRLREYRRQKDFERIKDAVDAANRFQPKGAKGRELIQDIQELGNTATWALNRKDELTQAITTSLGQQNYEEVRERLNEYGVLDDGPEYKELRGELPWRIAEHNIIALRSEMNHARQLLADKLPGQARNCLTEIENRLLSLGQLESQFPTLKGALIHDSNQPDSEQGSYAKAVISLSKDTEQLKSELDSMRQSIERHIQSAAQALQAQDYEGCLAICMTIKNLTAEPSPADVLEDKASKQIEQISRLLTRADDALRKRSLNAAERAANDVLTRFKADSLPARDLLSQIRRFQRQRAAVLWLLTIMSATVLYVLSIGPTFHFMLDRGPLSVNTRDTLRTIYQPVYWLHAHTVLRTPLDRYANQWNPSIFER
jgi:serine/threonine protein kinase